MQAGSAGDGREAANLADDALGRDAGPSPCHVLLSGFGPFGTHADNPSGQVVRALDGARLPGGVVVRGLVLPVAFDAARVALDQALARGMPVLALALGLAASRRELSVERVALNLADAPLPDASGAQPVDRPLSEDGPAARFATLPVKAIAAALRAAGHPAGLSLSAGSYVCNAVLYALLERLAPRGVPAGLLHLPPVAAWPLERQVEAVRLALEAAMGAATATADGAPPDGREPSSGGLTGAVD